MGKSRRVRLLPLVPRMTADGVDQVIAAARWLLIDFDGPVCDIYAGLSSAAVAARLRKVIAGHGVTGVPAAVASSDDPVAVFGYAASISPEIGALVEIEMTDQETAATATARPAPYAREVIATAHHSGRSIAVVSNASDAAVSAYLAQRGLADRIDCISARTGSDPALLTPSPHLLTQAITELGAEPAGCVLIAGTVTSIQAARAAGIASIGFASEPGRRDALAAAGATAVVASLADLVLPFRARPLPG